MTQGHAAEHVKRGGNAAVCVCVSEARPKVNGIGGVVVVGGGGGQWATAMRQGRSKPLQTCRRLHLGSKLTSAGGAEERRYQQQLQYRAPAAHGDSGGGGHGCDGAAFVGGDRVGWNNNAPAPAASAPRTICQVPGRGLALSQALATCGNAAVCGQKRRGRRA